MSLLDLVTGNKSSDASAALEQALHDIQGVKTPNAEDLQFQIQKLVQAGVISPEQAKTFLQNPNALEGLKIDQTGTNAQEEAISGLLDAAHQGGLNPAEQAKMGQIVQELNTQERGANDAVVQRQAERGALTGGETLAAQLANNQNATANANQMGLGTAGDAYTAMLGELTSAGNMGSGLQGQENQQSNTVAAATNAINQFNAAQQQQEENFNVGNTNTAQAANVENQQNIENQNVANENTHAEKMAGTHQTAYEDAMQKAAAEAGVSENIAQNDTTQGGQQAGLIGGIIGAGGNVAASAVKPPAVFSPSSAASGFQNGPPASANTEQYAPSGYSTGGEIHEYLNGGQVGGHPRVPGNSPANDTVPAVLSPGEIVLPRTVAHASPDHVMDFLNRIRKPKAPVHPHDVKTVFDALSLRRGEP